MAPQLRVEVTVPEGVEAVLRLPGRADETVGSGTHVRTDSRRRNA